MLRREPYQEVPVEMSLCPELLKIFEEKTGKKKTEVLEYFGIPWRSVSNIILSHNLDDYRKFYSDGLKEGTWIDIWGVAREPGSEAAKHMTYMRNPMKEMEDLEEIKAYPFPDFSKGDSSHQKRQVEEIHVRGFAAVGFMQCTIWETSWYIRGMENLMVDMFCEPEIATWIYDKVTEQALIRAIAYAKAGVDIIYLGDDIGMQNGPMMSKTMCKKKSGYRSKWELFVAPTHMLEPEVPWENIVAYVEACREYKVNKK